MKYAPLLLLLAVAPIVLHAEEGSLSCKKREVIGKINKATGIVPYRSVSAEIITGKDGGITRLRVLSSQANGMEAGGGVCDLKVPGDSGQKTSRHVSKSEITYSITDEYSDAPTTVVVKAIQDGYLIDLSGVSQSSYCGAMAEFPTKVLLKRSSRLCEASFE